ncbi:MAG: NAD-dependent epimerase/dehydratase family protein [Chloroflexota bacterium]|jgi:nucleoside-diphosphate-sugar epimerase|nr:NAD-dependent epimerase/dehydratase family protein [Chloroflexota bacterium]MDP6758623.1 NAD-dependent epimerase/dehydratase family protein [Chloroflexota bacterium]
MKVLVTGGAGDIGGSVVAALLPKHEVSILDRVPSERHPELQFLDVDLQDPKRTASLIRGFDIVVHLAALPDARSGTQDEILRVNNACTFNVLEAVRGNGIPRVVYGSSESASGYGTQTVSLRPDYFPIDSNHSSWPHEAYSLSKYFGEEMTRFYAEAHRIDVVSLRYCWVWGGGRSQDQWGKILGEASRGGGKDRLGAWIAVEDVAQGFALACDFEYDLPGGNFEYFYLTARDNFTEVASLDLVKTLWPDDMPEVRRPELYEANPKASLFDISKAERMLGYDPQVTTDDLREKFGIEQKT